MGAVERLPVLSVGMPKGITAAAELCRSRKRVVGRQVFLRHMRRIWDIRPYWPNKVSGYIRIVAGSERRLGSEDLTGRLTGMLHRSETKDGVR